MREANVVTYYVEIGKLSKMNFNMRQRHKHNTVFTVNYTQPKELHRAFSWTSLITPSKSEDVSKSVYMDEMVDMKHIILITSGHTSCFMELKPILSDNKIL